MFDDWHGDAHDVDFLERICSHQVGRHLARDKNNGHRIQIGIGNGGDEIGRAGAGCRKGCADFARCARIANGGHAAALFMTAQDMPQLGNFRQYIIDRHNRPARITKDKINTLRRNRL